MMTVFDGVTDQELKAELARREQVRKDEEARERTERWHWLVAHRAQLLELFPKHERTSCSDDRVINGFHSASYGPRCARCALLEMDEWNNDHTFELTLTIKGPKE